MNPQSINTVRDASHVLDTGVAVELLADESEEMYQTVSLERC